MSEEKAIRGVLTLVPTPFGEEDELDLVVFKEHVSYLESVGMQGIVVASSAGEFYTLTDEEFKKLATVARESCKNMLCVINCAYQNMEMTLARVKYAEEIGADCAMIYPYHYHQIVSPIATMSYDYFRMINEATRNIRFMIFNDKREISGGREVSIELYERLLNDFPRIAAIVEDVYTKSENESIVTASIFSEFSERVSILTRSEAGMFVGVSWGAKGCLATYGLAMPKFLLRLYDKCESGKWNEALRHQQTLTKYPWETNQVGVNIPGRVSTLFPGTFTTLMAYTHNTLWRKVGTIFPGTAVTCKALAEAAGRKVGKPRLPMLPPSPGMKEFATGWLADLKVLN